jgi:formamidopyrimidine-DNA glycosylase
MFVDLTGGKTIYIHLKMTGHLLVRSKMEVRPLSTKATGRGRTSKGAQDYFDDRVNQYIHHLWTLEKNKTLEFSDMRKFAKIVLLDTRDLKKYKDIKTLGVDAMSADFTYKKFSDILDKRKKAPIGIILMDQNLIAGIGNIYRSEILFEAKILPERLAKDLSDKECGEIYNSIKKVLKKAIKLRGTSDSDYRDTDGAPGGFQKVMKVYNQEKKKCPKCDTIIVRKKMGGRSVFYCPKCQI